MCLCLYLYLYHYCIFVLIPLSDCLLSDFVSVWIGFGCILSQHDTNGYDEDHGDERIEGHLISRPGFALLQSIACSGDPIDPRGFELLVQVTGDLVRMSLGKQKYFGSRYELMMDLSCNLTPQA